MNKKFIVVTMLSVILSVSVLGCIEQNTPPSETVEGPLNDLALTINDLNESFSILNEEHTTDPYIAEEGFLFEGWYITEKYQITFMHNDTMFIQHLIAQLNSSEQTTEFIHTIRDDIDTLGYDFNEIPCETIGNETYLGIAEITLGGKQVVSYFLSFRRADVIIVLQTAGINESTVISYAKLVAGRIDQHVILE